MALLSKRVPQNVAGRFYVDTSCIYCDLCVEIAPHLFHEWKARGWAFVAVQPASEDDLRLALDAMSMCPTESIGVDGECVDQSRTAKRKWWQIWG